MTRAAPLPSIRSRLGQVLMGLTVGWGFVVAAAVGWTVQREVDELLDDSLQASASVLAGVLQALPAGAAPLPAYPAYPAYPAQPVPPPGQNPAPPEARFAWQLVADDAAVVQRSSLAPEWALTPAGQPGFHDVHPDWRVYSLALHDGRSLLVAQARSERREARAEVVWSAALVALGVGLVSVLVFRWRIDRELHPLVALRRALEGYDPWQASRRLPPAVRDELAPIHAAIDQLGQRLALRVAGERAFSAQAAHALRTPLAGIDAQLAVALREAPPGLRPRLAQVRAGAARLSRVVAALLALFRSGNELHRAPVDVAALVARLPVEGLSIAVQGPPLASVDVDLLAATLLNLLDNALRHGGHQVLITSASERLRVQDDGQGVDGARRVALSRALADAATTGPSDAAPALGLGLLLADRVARAHGGALVLLPSAEGFAVELLLPVPATGSA